MENTRIIYPIEEVAEGLQAGDMQLVDVRDREFYLEEHIPGAVNIPEIFYFLGETTDDGLHTLQQTFRSLFSKAGLRNDKILIFYEDSLTRRYCGSCRGYWISRYLGQLDAGILSGGLDRWKLSHPSLDCGPVASEPSDFAVRPDSSLIATTQEVLDATGDPRVKLLDDRDRDEWDGSSSSPYGVDFAPRKGRIPGAVWIEWREFLMNRDSFPAFRSNEEIRELCASTGIHPDDPVIIYCFKGARASNTYVALKLAGFKNVKVYFGSWNEWSRHPELPVDESGD